MVEGGGLRPATVGGGTAPIFALASVHRAIAGGLRAFAKGAKALHDLAAQRREGDSSARAAANRAAARRLERLSAQFQFLEALMLTHTIGEDVGIYPLVEEDTAAAAVAAEAAEAPNAPNAPNTPNTPHHHHHHHHHHAQHDGSEEALFQNLGVALREMHADLRSTGSLSVARTGPFSKGAAECAEHVIEHMQEEERDILPFLAATCTHEKQCKLVWKTLSSMHTRLLEQVLPWLSEYLTATEMESLVGVVARAVPPNSTDHALLSRWRTELEHHRRDAAATMAPKGQDIRLPRGDEGEAAAAPAKRARISAPPVAPAVQPSPLASTTTTDAASEATTDGETAIDHIFDVHKAILRELDSLSDSASRLVRIGREHESLMQHQKSSTGTRGETDEAWFCKWDAALSDVSGRFNYLRSFYEAHSKAEDEIVFPALDKKEAIRNVSKDYMAEHERESSLFDELHSTISHLNIKRAVTRARSALANPAWVAPATATAAAATAAEDVHASSAARAAAQAAESADDGLLLARSDSPFFELNYPQRALLIKTLCSAIHATLSSHVRSEEERIWPLFSHYFTHAEQLKLVGDILGATSADVLKTMLSLVSTGCGDRELREMLASWRRVSQSTRFNTWLSTTTGNASAKALPHSAAKSNARAAPSLNKALNRASQTPGGFGRRKDGRLGCEHYARACSLVAPCCERTYACKQCHDNDLNRSCFPSRLDGFAVRQITCLSCGERQPPGQSCRTCGASFGAYFCSICRLFDDDAVTVGADGDGGGAVEEGKHHIFHCAFCNICRRGKGLGIDFFHCMQCNACFHMSLRESHVCRVENALQNECPICLEDMFSSTKEVVPLDCGHLLHRDCLLTWASSVVGGGMTCPLCRKSQKSAPEA